MGQLEPPAQHSFNSQADTAERGVVLRLQLLACGECESCTALQFPTAYCIPVLLAPALRITRIQQTP